MGIRRHVMDKNFSFTTSMAELIVVLSLHEVTGLEESP